MKEKTHFKLTILNLKNERIELDYKIVAKKQEQSLNSKIKWKT